MPTTLNVRDGAAPVSKVLIALTVSMRLYLSFYMIISDCDETFNYWEPLNLLVRGFGKQTWEYSPEYAIRSYAYLIPYYFTIIPISLMGRFFTFPSYVYFYWLRLVALSGFHLFAELKLSAAISYTLGSLCGNWFLFLSAVAPGMTHGTVALLPSSLALGCTSFATSYILLYINTPQTLSALYAIAFFLYGGIYGWPFALALAAPFGIYLLGNDLGYLLSLTARAVPILAGLVSVIVAVDSLFYKKLVLVPLNIVTYNVFGGEGEGPEIFGVEPFVYYVHNLLLNFNMTLLFGIAGSLLSIFGLRSKQRTKVLVACTAPLALWLAIFGTQEHKEERFLYPVYPLINMAAAVFISWFITKSCAILQSHTTNATFIALYKYLTIVCLASLIGLVSILRIVNLVENYSAPLSVFRHIAELPALSSVTNVCIGREWYHLPTSFFLPDNYRVRFVKSGFDGLLPGDFKETSLLDSTSAIPEDMNNKNQFSLQKITPFEDCDYYVDNTGPIDVELGEPAVVYGNEPRATNGWEILSCKKIIDPAGSSPGIGRLLYVPKILRRWVPYNVDYMDFCVAKKISQ